MGPDIRFTRPGSPEISRSIKIVVPGSYQPLLGAAVIDAVVVRSSGTPNAGQ